MGTSGGTESIFLAILSYRECGKKEKGIVKPNVVCFNNAHIAFDKACFYLGVELRKVALRGIKCDANDLRQAIDCNTICIVGSCPDYAHGNYNDMEELGKIAEEYEIGLHSDCCLGGFINPFLEEAGFKTVT